MKIGTIEKNVPPPLRIYQYPFREMEVGDSFVITVEDPTEIYSTRQKISANIAKLKQQELFKNFVFQSKMQRNDNWDITGFRIWRIK